MTFPVFQKLIQLILIERGELLIQFLFLYLMCCNPGCPLHTGFSLLYKVSFGLYSVFSLMYLLGVLYCIVQFFHKTEQLPFTLHIDIVGQLFRPFPVFLIYPPSPPHICIIFIYLSLGIILYYFKKPIHLCRKL